MEYCTNCNGVLIGDKEKTAHQCGVCTVRANAADTLAQRAQTATREQAAKTAAKGLN